MGFYLVSGMLHGGDGSFPRRSSPMPPKHPNPNNIQNRNHTNHGAAADGFGFPSRYSTRFHKSLPTTTTFTEAQNALFSFITTANTVPITALISTMAASDSNEEVGDFVDNDNLHLAPNAARFENDDEMQENEIDADEFEDDNSGMMEIIDGMDEIDDDEQDDDGDDNVDEFSDDNSESTTSECDNFLFSANTYYTPKKVVRVTVDPSVIELNYTFESCNRLTTVQLSEGLVRIGNSTFECCEMLTQINIPSSVKVIGPYAFLCCGRLEEVELCEGLEELGKSAFSDCYALQSITIPSTIKSINRAAFECCTLLRRVNLTEGLEYIGDGAFGSCPSLLNIEIPSTVKYISPDAFSYSRALMTVKFCDEVEEFVSGESMRDWWRNGVPKESLKTYNFLVQYKVPACLLLLGARQWQGNIHDMLRGIPSIDFDALDDQFTTIDAKLTVYEIIPAVPLLELAIWKSKLLELAVWKSKICECAQHDPSTMGNVSGMERSQCRDNCGACVIIPNVLPFLLKDIN